MAVDMKIPAVAVSRIFIFYCGQLQLIIMVCPWQLYWNIWGANDLSSGRVKLDVCNRQSVCHDGCHVKKKNRRGV